MADYHRSEIRTGLFVLGGLILFFFALITVGRLGRKLTPHAIYKVKFTHSYQIKEQAIVTFAGRTIGRVTNVENIPPEPCYSRHPVTGQPILEGYYAVQLSLTVDPQTVVKKDSQIYMMNDGLLGPIYVDISTGSTEAETVKPFSDGGPVLVGRIGGTNYLANELPKTLDRIFGEPGRDGTLRNTLAYADTLLKELTAGITQTREMIRTAQRSIEQNSGAFERTASNVESISASLKTEVPKQLESIAALVVEMRQTIAKAGGMMEENRADLRAAAQNAAAATELISKRSEAIARSLVSTLDATDRLARNLDRMIVEADPNVQDMLRKLRASSGELRDLLAKVRADPSVLLWGSDKSDDKKSVTPSLPLTGQDTGRLGPLDKD